MTVSDAIKATQGRSAGLLNQLSAQYAQRLIEQDETILAAVVANIRTRSDSYPGVVVLTDRRVLAACGLPGIRRSTVLDIEQLERCEEISSILQYKATFLTRKAAFSMTVDPDVGEAFSPFIAQINGEQFEDIRLEVDGSILNPNLLRSRKRNKLRREREKARQRRRNVQRQLDAQARFLADDADVSASKKS